MNQQEHKFPFAFVNKGDFYIPIYSDDEEFDEERISYRKDRRKSDRNRQYEQQQQQAKKSSPKSSKPRMLNTTDTPSSSNSLPSTQLPPKEPRSLRPIAAESQFRSEAPINPSIVNDTPTNKTTFIFSTSSLTEADEMINPKSIDSSRQLNVEEIEIGNNLPVSALTTLPEIEQKAAVLDARDRNAQDQEQTVGAVGRNFSSESAKIEIEDPQSPPSGCMKNTSLLQKMKALLATYEGGVDEEQAISQKDLVEDLGKQSIAIVQLNNQIEVLKQDNDNFMKEIEDERIKANLAISELETTKLEMGDLQHEIGDMKTELKVARRTVERYNEIIDENRVLVEEKEIEVERLKIQIPSRIHVEDRTAKRKIIEEALGKGASAYKYKREKVTKTGP